MRWLVNLFVLAGCVFVAGCGSTPKHLLRIAGGPDDALVHINDRYVGKLGRVEKRGIKLEPGDYRVTIDAVGYFPHDQLVTVEELAGPAPIQVELQEVPD